MSAVGMGWLAFGVVVAAMLALDLGIFRRESRTIPLREAVGWSALWVSVALAFWVGVHFRFGGQKGLEYLTGYLVEISLSADNVFVFALLFGYFRVPPQHQHRVLFWGILGALVMRGVFIAAGVTLIQRFHMIIYVFGAILIASGVRMMFQRDVEIHPERNPVLRLARRFLPVTKSYVGGQFFAVDAGRRVATPLLVVLLMVETTDVVFAVDSIPAVLAITQDPFIVFTSNVFAILGLRSMYFALAGFIRLFHYLSTGLAAILVLVGAKMLLSDVVAVPTAAALVVIALILVGSVVASVMVPPRHHVMGDE